MHYDSRTDGDFDEWLQKHWDMAVEAAKDSERKKTVLCAICCAISVLALLGAAVGYFVLK